MRCVHVVAAWICAGPVYCLAWPSCLEGFSLHDDTFLGATVPATPSGTARDCEKLCAQNTSCTGYSYHRPHPCSDHGEKCRFSSGCCYLKTSSDMDPEQAGGMYPNNNKCACSALMRIPGQALPLPPMPNRTARNVLYIIVDDLRPELPGPFGHDHVHAPNIAALAASGTAFRKAYAQIAVCSPTRMSFLTGRRPTTTRTMNFLDHFRQADCGINSPNVGISGGVVIARSPVPVQRGASGQCCTLCTMMSNCVYWSYWGGHCVMYSSGTTSYSNGTVSGRAGTFNSWQSLPEVFRLGGWLSLGTGKVFHTEQGGTGPTPQLSGQGMPPNQDPPSWTPGLSMTDVNKVAPMDDAPHKCTVKPDASSCPVDAQIDGTLNKVKTSMNDGEFEDRIIANDAILKLRMAASIRNRTGRPFILAVGFRKPHLAFRFPEPFLDYYPNVSDVQVAKHATLDPSIPPIAHMDTQYDAYGPGQVPSKAMDVRAARRFRLYYAAAISWMDSQLGRVLSELRSLGQESDTIVVCHGDHGWSLGEQGEWQKFTNFELGARVPLVIRDPVKPAVVSDAIVELVDLMPTLFELAGVPERCFAKQALDGTSLAPLLGVNRSSGRVALSLYPRCPNGNHPSENPADWWQRNGCLFIDRTMYSFMGLSLRTERWRYTEWLHWDGTREQPRWDRGPAAVELYDHLGDVGSDFDAFENKNLAQDSRHAAVAASLAALLREAYGDASWNRTSLPFVPYGSPVPDIAQLVV